METIDQKIKETDKSGWIYIPELKIEVQTKIHHQNKTYAECEKDLSKGESIPTYAQIQWLRNSEYRDKLGLVDAWEFVKQEKKISKEHGYVAFWADSRGACLGSVDYSPIGVSVLGVRFARKKNLEATN
jgi:hypothetical protein